MISHTRRSLCRTISLSALWPALATAAAGKNLRVAILLSGYEAKYVDLDAALLAGLRELGYVEGKNLTVDRRYAQLRGDQMLSIASELAGLKPDVIISGCTGSTRAAMQVTQQIPIVIVSVADPVGQGFVRSLARPGTNVTGRSSQSRELMPKMLELLHAALPAAKRMAVLVNTLNTAHEALWSDFEEAAFPLGLTPVRVNVRGPAGLDIALEQLKSTVAEGLLVLSDDPMSFNLRQRLLDAVSARKLPTLYGHREFVQDGGFMSYGENFQDSYQRAGAYVDKLARGAQAADLPIELPTRFQLVINLKTASKLGIAIPRTLLLRADELMPKA
ncbi:MAG: ABC transporter substrate-binding protein [Burkholderiaceae bacterium]